MKKRVFCTLGAWLTGAGLALAQTPEYKPARSFSFNPPPTPGVAPQMRFAPPPRPVALPPGVGPVTRPLQAVHVEPARPAAAPTLKRASSTTYQPMPSAPDVITDATPDTTVYPDSLPLSQFNDVVGPISVTDSSDADAVDGGVFTEGNCPLGDGRRAWVSAEFLMWWIADSPLSVPVYTAGTPASGGVIGVPGTVIPAGNNNFDSNQHYGGRLSFGYFVNDAVSFEASTFFLSQGGTTFARSASPNGDPAQANVVLARPFYDVVNQTEAAILVAAPNFADGRIDISNTNQLWGVELNTCLAMYRAEGLRINLLGGARFVDLEDRTTISSVSTLAGGGTALFNALPVTAPTVLSLVDSFQASNRWWGGQLGVQTGIDLGCFFVTGAFKVGAGVNQQELITAGQTSSSVFVDQGGGGGLLTQRGNIGTFERNRWSFLNEFIAEAGYRINERIAVTAGYSFLYLTGILRAGDQIDRGVNPALIPSQIGFNANAQPLRPTTQLNQADFWAQGVQCGLSFRY